MAGSDSPTGQTLAPIAVLTLGSHLAQHFQPGNNRMVSSYQHRAGLSFRYADTRVHGKRTAAKRYGSATSIARQPAIEQSYRDRLASFGFRPALRQSQAVPEELGEIFELPGEEAWLDFVSDRLDTLRAEGWDVEPLPGFLFDLTPIDGWYARIGTGGGCEALCLELGVKVAGRQISVLPPLQRAIQANPAPFSLERLASRSPHDRLRLILDHVPGTSTPALQIALAIADLLNILNVFAGLFLEQATTTIALPLHRQDVPRLASLETLDVDWQGLDRLEGSSPLRGATEGSIIPPTGLHAQLRPYQLEGLGWMQRLARLGVGGILADDMGLGKTLQVLAHLLLEKHNGRLDHPALIVMPTSLIPNWEDEAERFTPSLRRLTLTGSSRQRRFAEIAGHDLILTSYALLPRDIEALRAHRFSLVVLDEAQQIKNPASKAAHAAAMLDAGQRLCLSGTPVENHLGELWSLFAFLAPGWLGSAEAFNRHYRQPIEREGNTERLAQLRARIGPLLLRRRKEDVARELPPKVEIIQGIDFGPTQRHFYDSLRAELHAQVLDGIRRDGIASSQMLVLEALLKLRQACCDPRLVQHTAHGRRSPGSAKLEALMQMLDRLLPDGRRVLLFSQFTSMLELIGQALRQRGIAYEQLTGQTRDRRAPVERFQDGVSPVFLISTKAGGTGLNLTAADTVIHYDPWWNPAVENQATDRAYRIGQNKAVFVYKLIARGTVEERVRQLQQHKAALAAHLLQAESGGKSLAIEEVDALLAPMS
ncbi:DEAD/DEAH box helicase [Stutzerimonas urumqiensis]|uniref:DEAD/DEAH box helicase n=1 Tax=Stutzerimonas urumqiensis TaxID=638269 RepID=UPI003DA565F7